MDGDHRPYTIRFIHSDDPDTGPLETEDWEASDFDSCIAPPAPVAPAAPMGSDGAGGTGAAEGKLVGEKRQAASDPASLPLTKRAKRVRKQIRRWASDPLSVANLGGRQNVMNKVKHMAVDELTGVSLCAPAAESGKQVFFFFNHAATRAGEQWRKRDNAGAYTVRPPAVSRRRARKRSLEVASSNDDGGGAEEGGAGAHGRRRLTSGGDGEGGGDSDRDGGKASSSHGSGGPAVEPSAEAPPAGSDQVIRAIFHCPASYSGGQTICVNLCGRAIKTVLPHDVSAPPNFVRIDVRTQILANAPAATEVSTATEAIIENCPENRALGFM